MSPHDHTPRRPTAGDNYRFQLDKTTAKYECPQCHRRRFVVFRDGGGLGEVIDPTVGRCDREQSCGYMLGPREYFRSHPERTAHFGVGRRREGACPAPAPAAPRVVAGPAPLFRPVAAPACLPLGYVNRAQHADSALMSFLARYFGAGDLQLMRVRYLIGSFDHLADLAHGSVYAHKAAVIYFQIDDHCRMRTGKIMRYDPATGHRIKDEHSPGRVGWLHNLLKSQGRLPQGYELAQCFFGQELLGPCARSIANQQDVCIVESEKTALVCSMVYPARTWLATGGLGLLHRLLSTEGHVLRGRRVMLVPDKGCLDNWKQQAEPYRQTGLQLSYSQAMERTDTATGNDVADFIIHARTQAMKGA